MKKGKFIVIEGIDGAGKTTLIENLKTELGDEFHYLKNTSEGSPINKAIREVLDVNNNLYKHPRQMGCLFIAEMFLVQETIKEYLDNGVNVVCDRWWCSTLAYAGYKVADMESIYLMVSALIRPDLIIYLDIDPKVAIERINKRSSTKEVYDTVDKLTVIQSRYKHVFETYCLDKMVTVKGDCSPEIITADVVKHIQQS